MTYVPPEPEDDYGPGPKPCVTPEVARCLAETASQIDEAVADITRLDPHLASKGDSPLALLVAASSQLLALGAPYITNERTIVPLQHPVIPPFRLDSKVMTEASPATVTWVTPPPAATTGTGWYGLDADTEAQDGDQVL